MNLEALLEEAVNVPEKRAEFIDVLMRSNVYVIGMNRQNDELSGNQNQRADLFVLKRGSDKPNGLPIFTSKEALLNFAKELAEGTPPMLEVNCANVFKTAKNISILLNPNAKFGKEFTPPEIADIVRVLAEREKSGQVEVFIPDDFPSDVIVDLQYFFKKKKFVQKAYLFGLRNPHARTHYLFIVDMEDGDKDELFGEMNEIIEPQLEDDKEYFQIISSKEALSEKIMHLGEPFYVKKKGIFFR